MRPTSGTGGFSRKAQHSLSPSDIPAATREENKLQSSGILGNGPQRWVSRSESSRTVGLSSCRLSSENELLCSSDTGGSKVLFVSPVGVCCDMGAARWTVLSWAVPSCVRGGLG